MINGRFCQRCLCLLWVLLVVLFILEIFARILINIEPFYALYIKNRSDSGYRIEWIKNHERKIQSKRYNQRMDRFFEMPTRGWAPQPNIKNKLIWDNKILNTNSRGIRGKEEFDYQKDPRRIRVLALGDSFTYGIELSDSETWCNVLQRLLPDDLEVINFGVEAYGQDQMLLYLKEEGLKYQPDIIMLGYMKCDQRRNLSSFYFHSKPRFIWDWDHLKLINSPVPSPHELIVSEFWKSKLLDLINIILYEFLLQMKSIDKDARFMTDKILKEIVFVARENKSKIVLIYMDDLVLESHSRALMRRSEMEMFCKNERIDCVFFEPFKDSSFESSFLKEHHYAPFVQEIIASNIKDYLIGNGFIKGIKPKKVYDQR